MKTKILGLLAVGLLAGPMASDAWAGTIFTSTGPFALADSTAGLPTQFPATDPYPLSLTVSGLSGITTSVVLSFTLSHTFPDDPHFLLVSPTGQTLYVMGNAGGSTDVTGCALTFTDAAATTAPDSSALVCGSSYRPNSVYGATQEPFAAGAPAGPYGTAFSVFNSFGPNGSWSLYIGDAVALDAGTLHSWSLDITTDGTTSVPEPGTLALLGLGLAGLGLSRRRKAD